MLVAGRWGLSTPGSMPLASCGCFSSDWIVLMVYQGPASGVKAFITPKYRIAGISSFFRGGGGGVKISEPQIIYLQMINSDLVPRSPATNHAH